MKKIRQKERIGVVLSNKMQKTIIVRVTSHTRHPKYGKIVKKRTKFKVHDEKNIAGIGDTVRICQTRPISKEKRFRLIEVVKKAPVSSIKSEEIELQTK
ncbi:MAG: 30S ribosomal protein S17 [Candidatus Omnitrophica bacterium]|nr:30S ribosomal protein S17 [Candidatus Omnitrophota bacterium]